MVAAVAAVGTTAAAMADACESRDPRSTAGEAAKFAASELLVAVLLGALSVALLRHIGPDEGGVEAEFSDLARIGVTDGAQAALWAQRQGLV
jgi:hypothetical protein